MAEAGRRAYEALGEEQIDAPDSSLNLDRRTASAAICSAVSDWKRFHVSSVLAVVAAIWFPFNTYAFMTRTSDSNLHLLQSGGTLAERGWLYSWTETVRFDRGVYLPVPRYCVVFATRAGVFVLAHLDQLQVDAALARDLLQAHGEDATVYRRAGLSSQARRAPTAVLYLPHRPEVALAPAIASANGSGSRLPFVFLMLTLAAVFWSILPPLIRLLVAPYVGVLADPFD